DLPSPLDDPSEVDVGAALRDVQRDAVSAPSNAPGDSACRITHGVEGDSVITRVVHSHPDTGPAEYVPCLHHRRQLEARASILVCLDCLDQGCVTCGVLVTGADEGAGPAYEEHLEVQADLVVLGHRSRNVPPFRRGVLGGGGWLAHVNLGEDLGGLGP